MKTMIVTAAIGACIFLLHTNGLAYNPYELQTRSTYHKNYYGKHGNYRYLGNQNQNYRHFRNQNSNYTNYRHFGNYGQNYRYFGNYSQNQVSQERGRSIE